MSFFGKLKGSADSREARAAAAQKKADPNAPVPTPLEKHLADATGPVRPDGSDKFFGFENYGSTCYCNSIIQCLYYSAPFRERVLNFPPRELLDKLSEERAQAGQNGVPNGKPVLPRNTSSTPYPNPTSPARKPFAPQSPGPGVKAEESKDSPDGRKKLALAAGPVLEMTYDNSTKYGMEESLFTSLKDIFEAILGNQSRIGVVSPHKFLEILRRENEMFRSAMHQDAHEFLNLLLNQVVDNVELFAKQHPQLLESIQANGSAPEKTLTTMSHAISGSRPDVNGMDTHWVHDLFEGLLTSETRCLTCENTSQRDEAFLDLSVDLAPHTSVTSCLRKFSEEEMLCERNKFHCDNCGGLQEAEKRMKIKRLPRILALHLKRFKYTEDLQRLQKLFHKVQYPFHLRLFNTTEDAEDPDRLYELYAVVVHIGGGPYHGHYVSIVKTQDRGWLLFDDELVEPVDKSYVLSFFGGEPVPGVQDARQLACAYVLFYQETTMEAMLREQELEGQRPMESRVSQETAKEGAALRKADLRQTQTVITPTAEEMEHMEALAHASTAPALNATLTALPVRPHFGHVNTAPLSPKPEGKSKKDIKAEAKAEEKARKQREKEEQKELDEKRRAASAKRIEAYRQREEELRRVMEESKQTSAMEAKARGNVAPPEKTGGIARFKHGSISLRGKPRLFGKDKDGKLPPLPQEETPSLASDTAPTKEFGPGKLERSATTTEKVKQRFSLGRKKSQPLL
ncbi:cysteine proteinase [Teratosphaeria nubilosa]|uniref:Ubiquitin carboxyl-terminal hydrolase n=1 Tax=Teratosphaeria nubilosa TaxID=161662 RepID=A0A6G1LFZ2_9PEZI|nr:cysteine proteinase [Teratosphaeria nubilosa]